MPKIHVFPLVYEFYTHILSSNVYTWQAGIVPSELSDQLIESKLEYWEQQWHADLSFISRIK